MAYNFSNLLEPRNKPIGLAEKIKLAPLSWLSHIAIPANGSNLVTSFHEFITGKDFRQMLLLPDKNSWDAKSAGDKGSQQINHELKIFVPGLYAQAIEQLAELFRMPLIVLQPDCSLETGEYQFGHDKCFAWLDAETMTGTTVNGVKGFAVTITYAGKGLIYAPVDSGLIINGDGILVNNELLTLNS